ncbi:MAG: YHS domain-containing protein [Elusimicrobiota bacterium]
MKNALSILGLAMLLSPLASAEEKKPEAWERKTFTLEELKKFDGKEGRPAYAAVDGIVYDMTDVHAWKNGGHMGKHSAGQDLTRAFKEKAPKRIHIDGKVLEHLPKVGVVAAEPKKLCPVCKMAVEGKSLEEIKKAAKTFKFCSPECKKAFEKDPEKFLGIKKDKKKKGK